MNTSHHYFHDTRPLLHIAKAMRLDAESWHGWHGVYIRTDSESEHLPSGYPLGEVQSVLFHNICNINGNAYMCRDGEVIILTRNMPVPDLERLAKDLVAVIRQHCDIEVGTAVYDLAKDWRRFAFHCEEKAKLSREIDDILGAMMLPRSSASTKMREEIHELFDFYSASLAKKTDRTTRKVMVVEDDPLTRRMVAKTLKNKVELITAEDVEEAMVHYVLHAPDLVFLDIGLPGTNGKAMLQMILDHDPYANIVMFSGNNNVETIVETLELGARGFVGKPFREEQLLHYIEKAVS